ncbi:MAG TPA: hypothetical protein VFZ34_24085 [Blastocatellia bacterium]|nr:hypothetical protein [Blastocatellia bacterium]
MGGLYRHDFTASYEVCREADWFAGLSQEQRPEGHFVNNVEQSELKITSFVIKVWIERPIETSGVVSWQTQITHVESGHMTYVQDWGEAVDFIQSHLLPLGIKPDPWWSFKTWLRSWKSSSR